MHRLILIEEIQPLTNSNTRFQPGAYNPGFDPIREIGIED